MVRRKGWLSIINRTAVFFMMASAALMQLSAISWADAGDLDPSFGDNGKVITVFGTGTGAYDAVIQPDGKIVVVGGIGAYAGDRDFVLVRYEPDGSLDTSFGVGGWVTTDFPGWDVAQCVTVQPDGRIVAGGISDRNFALARYYPDGNLDPSFHFDGLVTTDFRGLIDWVSGITIQSDGKIVAGGLVGTSPGSHGYDFGLARYNPDGSLDLTFGVEGLVTTDFYGLFDAVQDLTLQEDGKIVAVGRAVIGLIGNTLDFGVVRYNLDGTLDSSFGNGGLVTTDFGSEFRYQRDFAASVAVQADGKVVVAGFSESSSLTDFDFALARYNPDGTLDGEFGSGGRVVTDFANDVDNASSVALHANGKIVVGGCTGDPSSSDFALARYEPDGSPDLGFGTNGQVVTNFTTTGVQIAAVAIQEDDKVVAAGRSYNDTPPVSLHTNWDFALARYGDTCNPEEQIRQLIAEIEALVASGVLSHGRGNSLVSKLEAAIKQVVRGNEHTAINQLQAFIREVEAAIRSGALSPEEGQPLIAAAEAIIRCLMGMI